MRLSSGYQPKSGGGSAPKVTPTTGTGGHRDREIRYLGDVKRLALNPGDIVVVSTDDEMSVEAAQRLRAQIQQKVPLHEVIVLAGGLKLGVLGKDAA